MTKLNKRLFRETNKSVGRVPVVLGLKPGTDKREDLVGLKLKGTRTWYVATVSDLYRVLALWHGQKESNARRVARKEGVPWRRARKQFAALNCI